MARDETQPRYVISIAARMVGVHTHTLRYYEKAGLLEPARSDSNLRLYSDEDVERLLRIRTFMDEMGINLAGVDVILKLLDRISIMQQQMDSIKKEIARMRKAGD